MVTGHDVIHEAERKGSRGVDRLGGEGHLVGDREGNALGEANEPARTRDQAARRFGDTELGVVGRDHHVAADHDLEAPRERRAVRRTDEGLGELALGDAAKAVGGDRKLTRREGLEVHAGAKRLVARGGEDDHPDVVVGLGLVERHVQRRRRSRG